MINGKSAWIGVTGKTRLIRRCSASLHAEVAFELKRKQGPAEKAWPADKEAEEVVCAKACGHKQPGRFEEMKSGLRVWSLQW